MTTRSSGDVGTLMQLRNLVNRRNIKPTKPKDDVNASEDFLQMIVECHVLTAAMEFFGMECLEDDPCSDILPPGKVRPLSKDGRKEVLLLVCRAMLADYVDVYTLGNEQEVGDDKVLGYAKEVTSLGLLYAEFVDGIREGDGLRVLRCWRFLMLLFKACDRKNYAIEAFVLLAQH